MNKWLLIWNLVLTVLMVGMIISGCSSIDPQFSYLSNQVKSNRTAIEQLASATNENRQLISSQAGQILGLRVSMQTSLNDLSVSLKNYVKQYVGASVD